MKIKMKNMMKSFKIKSFIFFAVTMSDEEQANRPMTSFLETITLKLQSIADNQTKMTNRLEKLESKEQAKAPPSIPDSPNASGHLNNEPGRGSDAEDIITAGQTNGGFEGSDTEMSDQELDYNVENYLMTKNSGPDIQPGLAKNINESFLEPRDLESLKDLHKKYPVPGNLFAVRVPAMNSEIKLDHLATTVREKGFCSIQQDVGTAVGIIGNIMSDMGKKDKDKRKFERADIWNMLNDTVAVLTSAHKKVTKYRKVNVKSSLNSALGPLCHQNIEESRRSNDELFDEDLTSKVSDNYKAMKVNRSKNGWKGPERGRDRFRKRYRKGNQIDEKKASLPFPRRGRGSYSQRGHRGPHQERK